MTKLFQKSYVNTRESQEEYGVYHIPKSWIKSKNSKKKCLIMKGNNTGGWSLTRQRCNVWYELAVRNIIHKKNWSKIRNRIRGTSSAHLLHLKRIFIERTLWFFYKSSEMKHERIARARNTNIRRNGNRAQHFLRAITHSHLNEYPLVETGLAAYYFSYSHRIQVGEKWLSIKGM